MKTEYAFLKLKYDTHLRDVKAKPLFFDSKSMKMIEVTEGFKYSYYPSLWLRDSSDKHKYDIVKRVMYDGVYARNKKFVYTIKAYPRGEYV